MGWLQRRHEQGVGPYRADAAMVHRGPHPGFPGQVRFRYLHHGPQPVRFARAQKGGGITCRNKTHRARRKHRPRPVRLSRPTPSPSAGARGTTAASPIWRAPPLSGVIAPCNAVARPLSGHQSCDRAGIRRRRADGLPDRTAGSARGPGKRAAGNPGYRVLGRLSAFGVLPRPSPQLSGHHPIASEAIPPFAEQSRRPVLCQLDGCFGHGSDGAQSARLQRAERAVIASLAEEIAHVKADHNGGSARGTRSGCRSRSVSS